VGTGGNAVSADLVQFEPDPTVQDSQIEKKIYPKKISFYSLDHKFLNELFVS
jgi:hypothetical protein